MEWMDRPDTAEISFRQLFLFEAIGDLKSVRRASEECSLSQPAVTQSLAKLERHLNVHLVDRRASGSYLNELGQIFHRRIKRFAEQSESAIVELGAATSLLSARPIMKRLTRSQVRMLIATVESIAFEHVPAVLGISSASIHRAARDLEANLRVPLFYRTANGMVVTPAGVDFGRKMKLALQEVESGIEELKEAQHKESRKIVIGAMPFGGSVLLASVLEEFLQIHPRVDVKITNEGAAEMIKALLSGDVDFVIGLLLETNIGELTYEALAPTPYSIVARCGHPLSQNSSISVKDIADCDWIVGIDASSRRACFEQLFAGHQGPQTPIATCVLPVIRQLLSRSDRLTLMTSYELRNEDSHQLCALPFGPIMPVPSIGFTKRANWLPTRSHRDFMDIVRAHILHPRRTALL